MKLLWAITVLKRAGAEGSLVNLAPALQQRGFTIEVAALRPPYDLAPDLEALGVRVHRLDLGRHDLPGTVQALSGLLRKTRPDILHAHLFWASLGSGLARFATPAVRGVATHHNLDYALFPARTPRERAVKRGFGALMRGFAGQTAVSRAVARHMERHLRLRNVTVIPNAFDMTRLRPDPAIDREAVRLHYGLPTDAFLMVMPARLVPEKGGRVALHALAQLQRSGRNAFLLFLGDGPERDPLETQIANARLQECAAICPPLPHEELFPLLQASDAFVSASTCEGLPLAPIEAMALQVPAILSDIPGVQEIAAPGCALTFPPRDPNALAERMATLLDDVDLRQQLARQGREHVAKAFDLQPVAEKWVRFYASVSK